MVQLPPSFFVYQNAVDFVIAPMEVRHTRKKNRPNYTGAKIRKLYIYQR